jgi:hypothetical protein
MTLVSWPVNYYNWFVLEEDGEKFRQKKAYYRPRPDFNTKL